MEQALDDAMEEGLVTDAALAQNETQRLAFWELREKLSDSQKFEGGSIKHDVSVPVSRIPHFIAEAIPAVERFMPGCRFMCFGHLGDGNLHFNVSQPLAMDKQSYLDRWPEMSRIVHDVVMAHGGSISAEHGIGQLKREDMRRIKSATELEVMWGLKTNARSQGHSQSRQGAAGSLSVTARSICPPFDVVASGGAFGLGGGALRAMTVGSIDEIIIRRRLHQRHDLLCLFIAAVEPQFEILRMDDDRAARVDGRHQGIGVCRDDRCGFQFRTISTHPMFPDSGEGHQAIIRPVDEVRLLLARHIAFPFVETIGRDEAAAAPNGIAEGRLFQNGFASGH